MAWRGQLGRPLGQEGFDIEENEIILAAGEERDDSDWYATVIPLSE